MTDVVNPPRRSYDSSSRQRRTRELRRAVLSAALELITRDGYTVMTMSAIAERAGVSTEFLYKAFGDKPRLVRELLDFAAGGDDEPVPMSQRPEIQRLIAEPDAGKVIDLYAELATSASARAGGLLLALAAAAPADPRLAEIWELSRQQRLAGATAVAHDLAGKSTLTVSPEEARDIVWTMTSPELHRLLVGDRGWAPGRYAAWLAATLRASLL